MKSFEELSAEVARLRAAGEPVDAEALAAEYGVEPDVVRGLVAMNEAVAEAPEQAPLPAPDLPEDLELQGEVGRGGMGVVYRAHQRSLDREVAVKVLRPGELVFGEALARFQRETRAMAKLRHPHIVTIHEVGESGGLVYYVMDLFEESLADVLGRKKRPMPVAKVVHLVEQVASAVAFVHQHGLIHRDLKPANVLLDADGEAHVADFGLAVDPAEGATLTATGNLLGTPDYMAPEQALGERARVSERTDVYALGAILYECLTGKKPFAGMALVDKIHAVAHEEPKPPRKVTPAVPYEIELICLKAMAKDPEDRYATAEAMAEDLRRFRDGRPVEAKPPTPWRRARSLATRRGPGAMVAATAAALALAFGWWGLGWGNSGLVNLESADVLWQKGEFRAAGLLYRDAYHHLHDGSASLNRFHLRERHARALMFELGTMDASDPARPELIEALRTDIEALKRNREDERDLLVCLHLIASARYLGTSTVPSWNHLVDGDFAPVTNPGDPLFDASCLVFLHEHHGDFTAPRPSVSYVDVAEAAVRLYPEMPKSRPTIRYFLHGGLGRVRLTEPERRRLSESFAAMADDPQEDTEMRALAISGLASLNDLPFDLTGVTNCELEWDEEAANTLIALWREGRSLDREERTKAAVVVAAAEYRKRESRRWLQAGQWLERLGVPTTKGFDDWWLSAQERHPREWLLEALHLEDPLSEEDLAELLTLDEKEVDRGQLHSFLTWTYPGERDVPRWPGMLWSTPSGLRESWILALGVQEDPVIVDVDVALAVIRDGVEPIEWLGAWDVSFDSSLTWNSIQLPFELEEPRGRYVPRFLGTQEARLKSNQGEVGLEIRSSFEDKKRGTTFVQTQVRWGRDVCSSPSSVPPGLAVPVLDQWMSWRDQPTRSHRFLVVVRIDADQPALAAEVDWSKTARRDVASWVRAEAAKPGLRRLGGDISIAAFGMLALFPNADLVDALAVLDPSSKGQLSYSSDVMEAILPARVACEGGLPPGPASKSMKWVQRSGLSAQHAWALASHPEMEVRRFAAMNVRNTHAPYDVKALLAEAWEDLPQELYWLEEGERPHAWVSWMELLVGVAAASLLLAAITKWARWADLIESWCLPICALGLVVTLETGTLRPVPIALLAAISGSRARRIQRRPVCGVALAGCLVAWTMARTTGMPLWEALTTTLLCVAVAATPRLLKRRAAPIAWLLVAAFVWAMGPSALVHWFAALGASSPLGIGASQGLAEALGAITVTILIFMNLDGPASVPRS